MMDKLPSMWVPIGIHGGSFDIFGVSKTPRSKELVIRDLGNDSAGRHETTSSRYETSGPKCTITPPKG